MFPARETVEEIVNGQSAFVAPKIGEFKAELSEEFARGNACRESIAIDHREEVLENDAAALRAGEPIRLRAVDRESPEEEMRHVTGREHRGAPGGNTIQTRWRARGTACRRRDFARTLAGHLRLCRDVGHGFRNPAMLSPASLFSRRQPSDSVANITGGRGVWPLRAVARCSQSN